jgi:hypothetical protein
MKYGDDTLWRTALVRAGAHIRSLCTAPLLHIAAQVLSAKSAGPYLATAAAQHAAAAAAVTRRAYTSVPNTHRPKTM